MVLISIKHVITKNNQIAYSFQLHIAFEKENLKNIRIDYYPNKACNSSNIKNKYNSHHILKE